MFNTLLTFALVVGSNVAPVHRPTTSDIDVRLSYYHFYPGYDNWRIMNVSRHTLYQLSIKFVRNGVALNGNFKDAVLRPNYWTKRNRRLSAHLLLAKTINLSAGRQVGFGVKGSGPTTDGIRISCKDSPRGLRRNVKYEVVKDPADNLRIHTAWD